MQTQNNCLKLVSAYGDSRKLYREAGNDFGVFRSRVRLAEAYLACGRIFDSREMYKEAVGSAPNDIVPIDLQLLGANLDWLEGNRKGAIKKGEAALSVCENQDLKVMLWRTLGRMHILTGNLEEGRRLTDLAYEHDQSPDTQLNYVALALCSGEDPSPWLEAVLAEKEKGNIYIGLLLKEIQDECAK